MPRLQTFTMDFDAVEYRKEEVEDIVDFATRAWRFPLGPREDGKTYLSAEGNPVEKTSWRGMPAHMPVTCATCTRYFPRCQCPWSRDRKFLLQNGLGPRIYTWSVTWTPRVGKKWERPEWLETTWPPPTGCDTWINGATVAGEKMRALRDLELR
jgi:hypothetical protein